MKDELSQALNNVSEALHERIEKLLPDPTYGAEGRLYEAMRYATLSEGKRLRPFLVVMSAGLFGVSKQSSLNTAAAIECIHAYSLVHDDLPALDDDDLRRGEPSCHKKYDEATAILVGDALLTLAFEILSSDATHSDSKVRCELVGRVASAAGHHGMIGGQMMDIISGRGGVEFSINEITRLQRMKTGELFAISCEAGAILGKAAPPLRTALRGYAKALGIAFQITDDLLDAESTLDETGLAQRKDKSSHKATYVNALGFDKAKEQAHMLVTQALNHLKVFDARANHLRDLAEFVLTRKH